MKKIINGYDFDGVITAGIRPESFHDVIITGRSYEEASETHSLLFRLGIFNAVYFNPVLFSDKTLESSGLWKAKMINTLKVDVFHEDDIRQLTIIQNETECNVIKIG